MKKRKRKSSTRQKSKSLLLLIRERDLIQRKNQRAQGKRKLKKKKIKKKKIKKTKNKSLYSSRNQQLTLINKIPAIQIQLMTVNKEQIKY